VSGPFGVKEAKRRQAKVQVLSCRCICRAYDGKFVVVNKDCVRHREPRPV